MGAAFVDQLQGLATRQPVLAVYEDAHWMDPTTLELLDMVVQRVPTLPILVVVSFRPEFVPLDRLPACCDALPLQANASPWRSDRRQGHRRQVFAA